MIKNGRQMSTSLGGIRDDHLARYLFAAVRHSVAIDLVPSQLKRIADLGCGAGYGTWLLGISLGCKIDSYDNDAGALAYGEENYKLPNITRINTDLELGALSPGVYSGYTAFEVIEHLRDPQVLLRQMRERAGPRALFVGSVPNQDVVPFNPVVNPWHHRHYTPLTLTNELRSAGWGLDFLGGQKGKHKQDAAILSDPVGCRTIVFVASIL